MLTESKIRERLLKREKTPSIQKAIRHQNRLRLHCQTYLTKAFIPPVDDFLNFAKSLLPHDKYKTFLNLFRYPVKSNEVTGLCFDKLRRIFDGQDPSFNYQFASSETARDWENYRLNKLCEPEVWQNTGWNYFRTEINSILVCDLPREQKGLWPEPYFYWLRIEDVIDYEVDNDTGQFDFIIFNGHHNSIIVIDDESYRVFDNNHYGNLGALVYEAKHDLGYCPARWFWTDSISIKDADIKESPITRHLEQLDWYLFYAISKEYLDLTGSYPIYSGYEQQCDYKNDATGDYCDGGFLKNNNGNYKIDGAGEIEKCPVCGAKRTIGPGSFVEVPIPEGDQPDLRNPVQILNADYNGLNYNVKEVERLRDEIVNSVVGNDEKLVSMEAVNEKQVDASFENQTIVLTKVKRGFEKAQAWADSTCCRLRYGNDFISAKINYGTKFFLQGATQLWENYKNAKANGASESELDAIREQIIVTEYRTNPTQMQRMHILSDLEPYRLLTREEVISLNEGGMISEEDMQVKLQFSDFIRRFEFENINILQFGVSLPYQEKISTIKKILYSYVKKNIKPIVNRDAIAEPGA